MNDACRTGGGRPAVSVAVGGDVAGVRSPSLAALSMRRSTRGLGGARSVVMRTATGGVAGVDGQRPHSGGQVLGVGDDPDGASTPPGGHGERPRRCRATSTAAASDEADADGVRRPESDSGGGAAGAGGGGAMMVMVKILSGGFQDSR